MNIIFNKKYNYLNIVLQNMKKKTLKTYFITQHIDKYRYIAFFHELFYLYNNNTQINNI